MDKIVILGANGYIGQHLTQKFIYKHEVELYLFDVHEKSVNNYNNYNQLNLLEIIPEKHQKVLSSANYIFHFSGITGTLKSINEYDTFININEIGLLNVLNSIKESTENKPRIIFPSTRLVYKGQTNKLLSEDAEKEFKTVYAINKFACEQYLEIYKSLYQIPYTIFRICVPYGNMLGSDLSFGTLSHFINQAKKGGNISIFGDGSLKRTFTHIDDLTELIIRGALNQETANQVFNIGSNDHLSLLEVANAIASIYKVNVELKEFPKNDLLIESGDTMFNGDKLIGIIGYAYKNHFKSWIETLKP